MTKPEFFSEARHDLSGPLAGIRVVEATTTAAGPLCSAMLADLGADAIKVETPRRRGESAATASSGDKVSWAQATFNRNKRSLILDLGQSRRPAISSSSWPLSATRLCRAVKAGIVYVSIYQMGEFGPYSGRPGYDPIAQAVSGFMSLNGSVDGPRPRPNGHR
jgi:formyl-CoA transferase